MARLRYGRRVHHEGDAGRILKPLVAIPSREEGTADAEVPGVSKQGQQEDRGLGRRGHDRSVLVVRLGRHVGRSRSDGPDQREDESGKQIGYGVAQQQKGNKQ